MSIKFFVVFLLLLSYELTREKRIATMKKKDAVPSHSMERSDDYYENEWNPGKIY